MQKLKKYVRTGNRPIAQIVKRLNESFKAGTLNKTVISNKITKLSNKYPNNVYVVDNNLFVQVLTLGNVDNTDDTESIDAVQCRVFRDAEPLTNHPCDSRVVGVFKVNCRNGGSVALIKKTKLKCRAILIKKGEHETSHIFLSILHDIHN